MCIQQKEYAIIAYHYSEMMILLVVVTRASGDSGGINQWNCVGNRNAFNVGGRRRNSWWQRGNGKGRRIKHLCAISESGLRVTRGAVTSLLGPLDLGLVFVTQNTQFLTEKSVVDSKILEPRQSEEGPVY
jgi:hypothetical protein